MAEQKPKKQNSPEPEAQETETERGFGTGLRAQLQRRQEPAADGPPPPQETPIVRGDLSAAAPASVSTNGSGSEGEHADLEHLRGELAAALAREQDLR